MTTVNFGYNLNGQRSGYEHERIYKDRIVFTGEGREIKDGLRVLETGGINLVMCLVEEDDIMKSETVLKLLYARELADLPDKKYLIINRWQNVDYDFYAKKLSHMAKDCITMKKDLHELSAIPDEARLDRIAAISKRSKSYLVRTLLEDNSEDMELYYLGEDAYKEWVSDGQKSYSLEEARKMVNEI